MLRFLAAAVILAFLVWMVLSNVRVEVTHVTVRLPRLPGAFSHLKIAQVSDLHNDRRCAPGGQILRRLREERPDLIVITGDLVDSVRTDEALALAFVREALRIAPVLYANGNHESRIRSYPELVSDLKDAGVTVLEDERWLLEKDGETLTFIGVNDPTFDRERDHLSDRAERMEKRIRPLMDGHCTVLLSHRPNFPEAYAACGVDLVFSGHAHGGQFRLPFLGGLYAPGQGILPRYDAGLYREGGTQMIVSRGLGNSGFPVRFNNPPELILAELVSGTEDE